MRCPQTYRRRRAGYFSDSRRCCLHAPGGSRGEAERRGIKRTPPEGRKTSHRAVRLGLHIGEVFYGNIGSNERLDFTVVGPAVYDVSRVVSMCRSVDRDLLASAEFVAVTPGADQAHFASVRRFALRGVRRTQDAPRGVWALAKTRAKRPYELSYRSSEQRRPAPQRTTARWVAYHPIYRTAH